MVVSKTKTNTSLRHFVISRDLECYKQWVIVQAIMFCHLGLTVLIFYLEKSSFIYKNNHIQQACLRVDNEQRKLENPLLSKQGHGDMLHGESLKKTLTICIEDKKDK